MFFGRAEWSELLEASILLTIYIHFLQIINSYEMGYDNNNDDNNDYI